MIRNLLRFVSLRHATTHLARTLLTLVGVVLGIGVFIAVRLAAAGIEASFSRMIEAVAGRAELTLTGGAGGIVEKWGTEEFVKVLQDRFPEIRHATPVIEVSPLVVGSDGEALTILGVDLLDDGYFREYQVLEAGGEAEEVLESPIAFLNSTNALLLSETFARRHGISVGDEIVLLTPLGERPFSVRGFLADVGPARGFGGNFALMQIDAVQIHFNRKGRYDRIDIATDGKTDLDELATRIEAAFGYDVRRPDFRNRQAERMMGNLELGLGMMSAMAIFVGMFLVYNTISISVVQRQREIGILRALGLPGRQARWLMLFEGGGIALFGSLAGLVFGRLIAGGILGGISRTIEKLYLRIHPGEIVLTPTLAIEGVSLGVFVAVAAAWLPAREATRIAPVETLRKERFLGHGLLPRYHRSALVGGVLFLLGVLLPHLPPIDGFPLFGFLGVYLLLAGVVLFIPRTLLLLRRGLATPLGNLLRIEGRLAADNMTRDIGRSAITIA
ncbi:MAG: ABC transporter permease, partial [Deltaproteobacteria bacterium]